MSAIYSYTILFVVVHLDTYIRVNEKKTNLVAHFTRRSRRNVCITSVHTVVIKKSDIVRVQTNVVLTILYDTYTRARILYGSNT